MKITKIACEEFAGIRDKSVALESGINVICGKNESGKSTLVNLISRTLFQNVKLNKRTDRDFIDTYLPAARKGSAIVSDSADGRISFETDSGEYTLTKVWGADERCVLSTPDGVIRNQERIDEVLKEVLVYGEGVYADMLLSSQRNTDAALQTILDASKKTDAKAELADAVSQAFAESDGISVDAIEQAIQRKLDEVAGSHWDYERAQPVRKTGGGRWARGAGQILEAYYAVDEAKAAMNELSRLEADADSTAGDYAAKDAAVAVAEEEYTLFSAYAGQLAVQQERKDKIARLDKELKRIDSALAEWPKLADSLVRARALLEEKANRGTLNQYERAKACANELKALEADAANSPCPTDEEIKCVRLAQRSITRLENMLCGINLNAAIKLADGHDVIITSLRTGERISVNDGAAAIHEAVKITVPNVMEMQLSPANVDVAKVEAELNEHRSRAAEIFARYAVTSVEALEDLANKASAAKTKAESVSARLSLLLGNTTMDALEAAAGAISGAVRGENEIERELALVCVNRDPVRYVAASETIIGGYADEYGSVNELKVKRLEVENALLKAKQAMSGAEDIPAEYAAISDPDGHLASLSRELKRKREVRETALTVKTAAASRLESFMDSSSENPREVLEQAQRRFDEAKKLLDHWMHIAEVFKAQKESIHDNPMQDVAAHFAEYLSLITDGRVSSEFPMPDKLNMNIYSANRLLDYGKLSEGTKETVSLAFRLAVLEHLFPEGGGVIVLDDPFADMDDERAAQASRLVKACAQRHQVIFLTCHEEYLPMLDGNNIFL